ncbi:unnamed protein product, partial [Effrenium voratum]
MTSTTTTCVELACRGQPNPFRWTEIEHEPKAGSHSRRGQASTPKAQVLRNCISRGFRSTEYEILHTGGFVRLCTDRGRVYWLAQNEHEHRLPDWKLHFSVAVEDIPRAWDILTELFLGEGCDFGMKAVAQEAFDSWPAKQRGRELTVYIFQNHAAYAGGGPMMGYCPGSEHNFWLGPEFEREAGFWASFVDQAEHLLAAGGIRSRGVAHGDLKLGHYASLRNEAFLFDAASGLYIYPPNSAGWNSAGHACPMHLPLRGQLQMALQQG